jgi:hypothetical protein
MGRCLFSTNCGEAVVTPQIIVAAARFMRPAMREKSDPDEKHRDPRFDHNLIEKHQVRRIGT